MSISILPSAVKKRNKSNLVGKSGSPLRAIKKKLARNKAMLTRYNVSLFILALIIIGFGVISIIDNLQMGHGLASNEMSRKTFSATMIGLAMLTMALGYLAIPHGFAKNPLVIFCLLGILISLDMFCKFGHFSAEQYSLTTKPIINIMQRQTMSSQSTLELLNKAAREGLRTSRIDEARDASRRTSLENAALIRKLEEVGASEGVAIFYRIGKQIGMTGEEVMNSVTFIICLLVCLVTTWAGCFTSSILELRAEALDEREDLLDELSFYSGDTSIDEISDKVKKRKKPLQIEREQTKKPFKAKVFKLPVRSNSRTKRPSYESVKALIKNRKVEPQVKSLTALGMGATFASQYLKQMTDDGLLYRDGRRFLVA